jgi:hypothetical protein
MSTSPKWSDFHWFDRTLLIVCVILAAYSLYKNLWN